ncbi:hypothetical protein [Bacillus sp. 196mf]|uniref:hypothetical protein n=1 Tax=Bacillus sp. 196mf TaxID=1761754 RepID=UPI000D7CA7F6|nr:hypothetical protein [Bacillus sp. 196mf]PYE88847.1 hypothetical protein ATL10_10404 [Bacillus sp. 196mf]
MFHVKEAYAMESAAEPWAPFEDKFQFKLPSTSEDPAPFSFIPGSNYFNSVSTLLTDIKSKVTGISDAIDSIDLFIKNLPQHIYNSSVTLLNEIFELVSNVLLKLPAFLFETTIIKDQTLVFFTISLILIMILCTINSINMMLRKPHTPIRKILHRIPLALLLSGAAPTLFAKGFSLLNLCSDVITGIGVSEIKAGELVLNGSLSIINLIALIGFDLLLISTLIPVLLKAGRRWFDLMLLVISTPLAFCTWIFDQHRHWFNLWWKNVKQLSLIQLIHATFITFMAIVLFATRGLIEPNMILLKILFIIGGFYRVANPPGFLKGFQDNGDDVFSIGKSLKSHFTRIPLKGTVMKLWKKGKKK